MEDRLFTQLYHKYSNAIYSVICTYIKDRETAKDVLQLTFIKISKHLIRYDPAKGVLYTWIRRIAVNTSLDLLKSVDYRNNHTSTSLQEIDFDQLNFCYHLGWPEKSHLEKLINTLTDNEKVIIDMLYLQEYTQMETSAYLHIPLGTVKSRVRSAIQKLRRQCTYDIKYYYS
jgi:RNA polymerase sigma factor (sigma-70 family)